jgi:uncharacterized membrane protein YphA (DoxX/SURF4 family)
MAPAKIGSPLTCEEVGRLSSDTLIFMYANMIKLFLRLSLGIGFLSAVADRFGFWHQNVAWGNWENFLKYTAKLTPWLPEALVPVAGIIATVAEIIFAVALLVGFRTRMFAQLSGGLLLVFAFSMAGALGIKPPLDYSVFAASAGAFALSLLPGKFLELDNLFFKKHNPK